MFHDPMLHQTFMKLFPSIPNCYSANVIRNREMVLIRNRIELAMLDRVMPQLTTLTVNVPLQVPRIKLTSMANLRRLELLGLSDQLEWTNGNGVLPEYAMTQLDKMLLFIWDHQRMFGTLRELKIENKQVQHRHGQLIRLVEAMGDRLEVLDVQFWTDATFYLDRFPTQQLKCLLLRAGKPPEPILGESSNMATFLSRCTKVQEIQIYTNEKDLFKVWRPGHQIETSHTPVLYDQHREMARITIAGVAECVISNVNEAVELFASTLETLTTRSWYGGRLAPVHLSWSRLTLSRLTELDLEGEVAWTFDFASLLNCPRLSRIRLAFTGPMPKKHPSIDNLTRVPNLQDVELGGIWLTLVNRGWPAVIARIYHLERLDLLACDGLTADQVFELVLDVIEQSAQWRLQVEASSNVLEGSEEQPLSSKRPIAYEYLYKHCRLQWVIVNKRLENQVMRQWRDWRKRLASAVTKGELRFLRASAERVHFSFVPTARPSH
ncbi:hypothetical protein BGZ65_003232 [Modicella reniformis]|uniref:Uncharacterized protein n=1 Tax=Modicella reniformis TaxID=1440133 RepID=A0A9P6M248_9FUNG|nr:hypothetical protein BGZ65_003232 [Modicella reniformis]